MTIEIGRLVVQGQFGEQAEPRQDNEDLQAMIEELREEILQEVTDMLEERSKHARDR